MKRLRILALLVVLVSLFAVPTTMARKDITGSERVLVHFEPGQKAGVRNAILKANGNIHVELDNHNVIAVTLPTAALNGISRNPNVTLVELDQPRRLMDQDVPYGIDAVQALDVWDANLDGIVDPGAPTGEGVKVCIIDSGIYDGHEDFAGVNIQPLTDPYIDKFCGHGSHVAGTIAAANNDTGVVGVTPGGATLQIVKVFDGADCAWTYTSKLVQAADYCEAAGADIISMSLGGASSSRLEERAFNGYYANGILSIAAAGNDEVPDYSYPASYDSVVSVAAVDVNNAKADFSQWNDQVELSAPGVDVMSTVPWISNTFVEVNGVAYSANQIEFAPEGAATGALVDGGLCLPDDVVSADAWAGKVVLCQRGDVSFLEKVQKAQDHGGVAAVIYNNEPGNFLGTLGEEVPGVIPAVSVSDADGATMVALAGYSAFVQIQVIRDTTGGYEAWGGTSMATPHVSGVAALIWSAVPDATNVEIREAMTATALRLGTGVPNDEYGYGLVQAAAAIEYLTGGTPDPTPTPTETVEPPTPTPTPTTTPEPPTPTPTSEPSEIVINAPTFKSRGRNMTISWTTNVPTTSSITINGGSTLYSDNALSTSHQVTIKATVTEVYIYAEDASGNTAEAGPFYP